MQRDLASLAGEGSIFGGSAAAKLERLQAELRPLSCRYDVVVANPPYMGSSNMNKWLAAWVKSKYKEAYRDLCTCFIKRGMSLAEDGGYEALITSDTCMYISSFEQMRKMVIDRTTIVTFIDTRGTNAHPDVFDANAGWMLWNHHSENVLGAYFKLNHPIAEKGERLLEALADPDCGWFYRTAARDFAGIPGTPVVYWATKGVLDAFKNGVPISSIGQPRQGLATGENARFVRQWWEVSHAKEHFDCPSIEESIKSGAKWFPYNKGGEFRKWYGNNDCVINWKNGGEDVRAFPGSVIRNPQSFFKPCITWSKISSGSIAFRYKPAGHVFDVAGTSIFAGEGELKYLQAACNSSVILRIAGMLSPTLNFEVGQIATYPILFDERRGPDIRDLVAEERYLSKSDWDAFEISWDFRRHPLL